jgi:hypothetical protein
MSQPKTDADIGKAIQDRMDALRLDPTIVHKRGGPSDKPLKGYTEGNPIGTRSAERRLCAALRWTPDSIERMRKGLEPIVLADETVDPAQIKAGLSRVKKAIEAVEELLP